MRFQSPDGLTYEAFKGGQKYGFWGKYQKKGVGKREKGEGRRDDEPFDKMTDKIIF